MLCVPWWRLTKRVPGDISTKEGAKAIAHQLRELVDHVRSLLSMIQVMDLQVGGRTSQ